MGSIIDGEYVSAFTGDEIDSLLGKTVWQSNPNLLDNWYFVGGGSQQGGGQFPINQRGQTSYSEQWAYAVDRWRISDGVSVSLQSDGLKVTVNGVTDSSYIYQNHENGFRAGLYTLSVLFSDNTGTIALTNKATDTGVVASVSSRDQAGLISLIFDIEDQPQGDSYERIHVSQTATIIAVKLELGDTQTLAHQDANDNWVLNETPNYQQELAKCQRYQLVIGFDGSYSSLGVGQARTSDLVSITVPTPVSLRLFPSATIVGGNVVLRNKESGVISSSLFVDARSQNSVILAFSGTGATAGAAYEAYLGLGVKLILDANL